ncbi:hypothetical protein [Noviherbaspirillum agri]
MKKLLIAFLLAIFTAQATVAVLGDDTVARAQSLQFQDQAASTECSDAGESDVVPTIEELSDYVPFEFPASASRFQAAVSSFLPARLASIDLPGLEPPPKA